MTINWIERDQDLLEEIPKFSFTADISLETFFDWVRDAGIIAHWDSDQLKQASILRTEEAVTAIFEEASLEHSKFSDFEWSLCTELAFLDD